MLTTHLRLVPRSKNAWSYTSTPQYAFMAWCSVRKSTETTLPLLDGGERSVSGPSCSPPPGKKPFIRIEWEDWCAPEPVWMRLRRENIPSFPSPGFEIRSSSPQPSHCIDWATLFEYTQWWTDQREAAPLIRGLSPSPALASVRSLIRTDARICEMRGIVLKV
jgi:hypothetical protein